MKKQTGWGRIGAVLLVLALGGGVVAVTRLGGATAVVATAEIPTAVVRQGVFLRTVDSIGELKAARSAIITSPFDGKVVRLLPEGTRVEKGDTLVWLDTARLEEDLQDREAQLALAEKDLESAREEYRLQEVQNDYNLKSELSKVELAEQRLKDTEQKFEVEKALHEKGISARSKLDDAEMTLLRSGVELRNARINLKKTEENLASNLRVKQTGIEKAKLEVERQQKEVEDLKKKLADAEIKAPEGGEVAYLRFWKNGAVGKIAEGDDVWPRLNLLEIPDRSEILAVVPVNEMDIASVEIGQPATVRLEAVPGKEFRGTVARKSIVPIDNSQQGGRRGPVTTNTNTGPREFEVQVKVDQQGESLFQGMTAGVRIEVQRIESAVQVPVEALTLEEDKVGVFTAPAGGKGTPAFVPVKVLAMSDRAAAVEGALKENQRVFVRHPLIEADIARTRGSEALRRTLKELEKAALAAGAAAAPPAGEGQGGTERRRRRSAEGGNGGSGMGMGEGNGESRPRPSGEPALRAETRETSPGMQQEGRRRGEGPGGTGTGERRRRDTPTP